MTNPTPEAIEAVAALITRPCAHPGHAPMECQGCGWTDNLVTEVLAAVREAIHRKGEDADAIRETLGLRVDDRTLAAPWAFTGPVIIFDGQVQP